MFKKFWTIQKLDWALYIYAYQALQMQRVYEIFRKISLVNNALENASREEQALPVPHVS